jgi:hypothetical protein
VAVQSAPYCSATVTMVDAMLVAQKVVGLIAEFPPCAP